MPPGSAEGVCVVEAAEKVKLVALGAGRWEKNWSKVETFLRLAAPTLPRVECRRQASPAVRMAFRRW